MTSSSQVADNCDYHIFEVRRWKGVRMRFMSCRFLFTDLNVLEKNPTHLLSRPKFHLFMVCLYWSGMRWVSFLVLNQFICLSVREMYQLRGEDTEKNSGLLWRKGSTPYSFLKLLFSINTYILAALLRKKLFTLNLVLLEFIVPWALVYPKDSAVISTLTFQNDFFTTRELP